MKIAAVLLLAFALTNAFYLDHEVERDPIVAALDEPIKTDSISESETMSKTIGNQENNNNTTENDHEKTIVEGTKSKSSKLYEKSETANSSNSKINVELKRKEAREYFMREMGLEYVGGRIYRYEEGIFF